MQQFETITENAIRLHGKKQIPIRNLWLLMLYASDLFHYAEHQKSTRAEENPDEIPDLIAEILSDIVSHRLRRNLNFSYQPRQEILRRVRGRIDLLRTERHHLLQKAQVACRFEELTVDTPRNRFVRDALEFIAGLVTDKALSHKCRMLAFHLRQGGVIGNRPSRPQILGERFARHDNNDRQMVFAALLAFDLALPDESGDGRKLFAPDFEKLWKLYEKAVFGFYKTVLKNKGWSVIHEKRILWDNELIDENKFMPMMKPDITIESKEKRIIIDTKCTDIFVINQLGDKKFDRSHIFQIYAYLRSQENGDDLSASAEGVLLYPSIDVDIDERAFIQGHEIRFKTVNLAAEAIEIRQQLLQAIESPTH